MATLPPAVPSLQTGSLVNYAEYGHIQPISAERTQALSAGKTARRTGRDSGGLPCRQQSCKKQHATQEIKLVRTLTKKNVARQNPRSTERPTIP
jgi:hypothetical protein